LLRFVLALLLAFRHGQVHRQNTKFLARAIVQLARNAAPLLVLRLIKPSGKFTQLFFISVALDRDGRENESLVP